VIKTTPQVTSDDVANAVLEAVPALMRAIRAEMRRARPDALSVPKFRTLRFIRQHPSTNLASIAEHLGSSPASASELVSRLVADGLATSATNQRTRREVVVGLTPLGAAEFDAAEGRAREWLRGLAEGMDGADQARVVAALRDLVGLVDAPDERREAR
jgi:DNA-binding MarR family transcriptional regulator